MKLTKEAIRRINKAFRAKDQSHLWPIEGAFCVADRAINQARRLQRESGGCYCECPASYEETLERLACAIVNNSKNW